jgi:hypothetical protein
MCRFLQLVFICLVILFFLTGTCIAAESPSYITYIQGGKSSVTNGSDGINLITVTDVVPFFHVSYGDRSYLVPVELLSNISYPLNAGVVLTGGTKESRSVVEVSNLSLSDGMTKLMMQFKPLDYYDGSKLKIFKDDKNDVDIAKIDNVSNTGIYLELIDTPPNNNNELAQTIADLK